MIGEFKERPIQTIPTPTTPPKPEIEEAELLLWQMQQEFFAEFGYFPDRCRKKKKRHVADWANGIIPPSSDPPPPKVEDGWEDEPEEPR